MMRLLAGRRRDERAERVLFALVANRALAPSSKLAAARWINEDVLIDGLPATSDDTCYRAMDWLIEIKDALEQEVFGQVASLLNLERGQRTGEFDDRLPVSWLITTRHRSWSLCRRRGPQRSHECSRRRHGVPGQRASRLRPPARRSEP